MNKRRLKPHTIKIYEELLKQEGVYISEKLKNPIKKEGKNYILYVIGSGVVYECLIDNKSLKKISLGGTWLIQQVRDNKTPYVMCVYNKKRLLLHRYLTNCPKNKVVDHINGNPLDNRKVNLKIVTPGQNMLNKKTYKNTNIDTNIMSKNGYYLLHFIRKFNSLDIAKQAKNDIKKILDNYSMIDLKDR